MWIYQPNNEDVIVPNARRNATQSTVTKQSETQPYSAIAPQASKRAVKPLFEEELSTNMPSKETAHASRHATSVAQEEIPTLKSTVMPHKREPRQNVTGFRVAPATPSQPSSNKHTRNTPPSSIPQGKHSAGAILEQEPQKMMRNKRLIFFVLLYLCGALFAGILYPMLRTEEHAFLQHYLANKYEIFQSGTIVSIFTASVVIAVISLTLVFFSGLSAFGIPLISAFLVLKGIGNGIFLLQTFFDQNMTKPHSYIYLTWFTIQESFFMACICLLSIEATRHAQALFQYSFRPDTQEQQQDREVITVPKGHTLAVLSNQYIIYGILLSIFSLLMAVAAQILQTIF